MATFLNFWKNNNDVDNVKRTTNLIECAEHVGIDTIDESILEPLEMLGRSSDKDDSRITQDSDSEINFREELFKY